MSRWLMATSSLDSLEIAMLRSMSANKEFQTWHLIGWQHSHHWPTSQLQAMLLNLYSLTCTIFSNPGRWCIVDARTSAISVMTYRTVGMASVDFVYMYGTSNQRTAMHLILPQNIEQPSINCHSPDCNWNIHISVGSITNNSTAVVLYVKFLGVPLQQNSI